MTFTRTAWTTTNLTKSKKFVCLVESSIPKDIMVAPTWVPTHETPTDGTMLTRTCARVLQSYIVTSPDKVRRLPRARVQALPPEVAMASPQALISATNTAPEFRRCLASHSVVQSYVVTSPREFRCLPRARALPPTPSDKALRRRRTAAAVSSTNVLLDATKMALAFLRCHAVVMADLCRCLRCR